MKFFRAGIMLMLLGGSAFLQAMTVREALEVATKVEAMKGQEHRLYSLSFEKNKDGAFFAFTFFDGEDSLHSVNVDADSKTRYQLREAAKMSLFEDVEFSKLPACDIHCAKENIEDLVGRARKALEALGIEQDSRDSLRLTYHVRRNRDEAGAVFHCWSVTLPIKDKGEGMRVGFVDGELRSVNPAKLR